MGHSLPPASTGGRTECAQGGMLSRPVWVRWPSPREAWAVRIAKRNSGLPVARIDLPLLPLSHNCSHRTEIAGKSLSTCGNCLPLQATLHGIRQPSLQATPPAFTGPPDDPVGPDGGHPPRDASMRAEASPPLGSRPPTPGSWRRRCRHCPCSTPMKTGARSIRPSASRRMDGTPRTFFGESATRRGQAMT